MLLTVLPVIWLFSLVSVITWADVENTPQLEENACGHSLHSGEVSHGLSSSIYMLYLIWQLGLQLQTSMVTFVSKCVNALIGTNIPPLVDHQW